MSNLIAFIISLFKRASSHEIVSLPEIFPEFKPPFAATVVPQKPGEALIEPGVNGSLGPTPHFYWHETMISETAARNGINNDWSKDLRGADVMKRRVTYTCQKMEVVRRMLGGKPIIVTSMFRNAQLNAAIGGSANSSHKDGWAVDFACPAFGTTLEVARHIRDNAAAFNLDFDQLIQENEGWVHVGFDPKNRKQTLTWYADVGQYVFGIFDRASYLRFLGR